MALETDGDIVGVVKVDIKEGIIIGIEWIGLFWCNSFFLAVKKLLVELYSDEVLFWGMFFERTFVIGIVDKMGGFVRLEIIEVFDDDMAIDDVWLFVCFVVKVVWIVWVIKDVIVVKILVFELDVSGVCELLFFKGRLFVSFGTSGKIGVICKLLFVLCVVGII